MTVGAIDIWGFQHNVPCFQQSLVNRNRNVALRAAA
jgi:hypothetical protein